MKQEKRNGHAFHPIMRKGGVHEKTNKAKRKSERQDTDRKVKDWLGKGRSKQAADDSAAFFFKAA
ncbi:MAG: hypothetical protein AAGC78_08645 [Cellvibrio sp.]|jgi:hypothetical protein|uniref:hypothetical protein n=1 Tax=Cellvibrio sp. TaxID=1965322 RepID=UPI00319F9503